MSGKFFLTFFSLMVLSFLFVRYTPRNAADNWFAALFIICLGGSVISGIWWIWS